MKASTDWAEGPLGHFVTFLSGGTPSRAEDRYWHGDIPWVTAKDMKRFFLTDSEDHLTVEGAANGTRIVPEGTTLILVRGMTLHKDLPICIARRPVAFNQDVKAVLPRAGTVEGFIPYLLLANKQRLLERVDSAGHGTGRLNADALASLQVSLPSEEEQHSIAATLRALDEKIALNRRMSQTLEAVAWTLFQSRFLAAEKSKTWSVGVVADSFDVTMGQSPPGATYNTEGAGIALYQGRTDFGFRFPTPRLYTTAPARLAHEGDTLVSVRAPVGDLNLATEECAVGRGVAAIRHKSGSSSFTYYSMLAQRQAFDRFEAEGTIFGSISKKDFAALPIRLPSSEDIRDFDALVTPIDKRIAAAHREIWALSQLRETLIGKFLSGQLRLSAVA